MKILERKEPTVIGVCPCCGSKLEIEKGDIKWYRDMGGDSSPYITCPVCGKTPDVEGWKGISKLY